MKRYCLNLKMIKQSYLIIVVLLTSLLLNANAVAAESREISWDDLLPPESEYDDVFTRLDEDTLWELGFVVDIRDQIDAGEQIDEETLTDYRNRIKSMEDRGIDVEGLIAMRDKVVENRTAKDGLANNALNGELVRMPGYVLPLEFDGDIVTEFLLVPYVGACIHTPPPPPNQIVYVKILQEYIPEGGLYTPVWVNGTMTTEQIQSNLSFVDGSAGIPSAYAIEATSVEPYE